MLACASIGDSDQPTYPRSLIRVVDGRTTCADQEEETGGPDPPPPLENYKNIGFLSNTGPDPLKITKLQIQHSILGHHLPASETPFKWRFAGGPLMTRL